MTRFPMLRLPPVVGACLLFSLGPAQDEEHPPARPEDVQSIEAIVGALYDVVSGPAGDRDWNRFESLFVPEIGRFTPIAPAGTHVESWTPRDYEARLGTFHAQNDFYAKQVASRVERFGHVAHVFSTFGVLDAPGAETPVQRGINSIQLFFDAERWWILSVAWDAETESQPIPAEYLR